LHLDLDSTLISKTWISTVVMAQGSAITLADTKLTVEVVDAGLTLPAGRTYGVQMSVNQARSKAAGSDLPLILDPFTNTAGDHVVDLLTGYQFTVNHGPTITEIDGTTIAPSSSISISMGENTSQTVDVTIADIETNATELVLTASSSNVALLPASGITLAGSGSARTVTFQPLANKNS
jgi:hypothetical protein